MESSPERACPSCGAPAQASQRWCLECGGELPGPRRPGLRPAIGIATTLAVLVGAASAGGYTVLQEDKQPPPPATTVAQTPPATTPATVPPATQDPLPYDPAPSAPPAVDTPRGGGAAPPADVTPPATPPTGAGAAAGGGSVEPTTTTPARTTPQKPVLALTDIALGAAAVAYAPYAPDTVDLGDPSRVVDGSTRTVWKAPPPTDPGSSPQAGVYVDLASKEELRKLVLDTPTPGMDVEVYAATSGPPATITDPGWTHLASRADVAAETTVKLPSTPYRYVLVWITAGPPDGARAAISELQLLSLQPE